MAWHFMWNQYNLTWPEETIIDHRLLIHRWSFFWSFELKRNCCWKGILLWEDKRFRLLRIMMTRLWLKSTRNQILGLIRGLSSRRNKWKNGMSRGRPRLKCFFWLICNERDRHSCSVFHLVMTLFLLSMLIALVVLRKIHSKFTFIQLVWSCREDVCLSLRFVWIYLWLGSSIF